MIPLASRLSEVPRPDRTGASGRAAPSRMESEASLAYERGLNDGRAAALALAAAREENLKSGHDAALRSAREDWAKAEGEKLAADLQAQFTRLETEIAETVAACLEPFLVAHVRDAAVEALKSAVADILTVDPTTRFRVSGNADLIAHCRAVWGVHPATLTFVENDSSELSAHCDMTVLETRIAEWLGRIGGGDS